MRLRIVILLLLLAVLGIEIYRGIEQRVAAAAAVEKETATQARPAVAVIHPKPGNLQNELVLPGNVQAFTDAPIYARANGYLRKWYADIGAHVKQGQVLADIEAPEVDQQVREAQAQLEQSRAALEQATANLEQGRSNASLAKLTADRWGSLVGKGAVSKQENDQYQAQAQAQQASVKALEQSVASARNNISVMEANLARLRETQGFLQVRAPFEGVITARGTDVGALVSASGNGAELFHMAAVNPLRVFVSVPEASTGTMKVGAGVKLTVNSLPGREFTGKIVRRAGAIDMATRTLLTEIEVPNPTGAILPGSYARVRLPLADAAPTLRIPVASLIFRSDGLRVAVIRDNDHAVLVPVTIGRDLGTEVELSSGLTPEDWVLESPPDSLVSGAPVRIVRRDAK
jgi:multidrug efflux pump subunit AcrA (membrane-fusion protein)